MAYPNLFASHLSLFFLQMLDASSSLLSAQTSVDLEDRWICWRLDFTAGECRYKSRRFRGLHQVSMIFQKREHTGS